MGGREGGNSFDKQWLDVSRPVTFNRQVQTCARYIQPSAQPLYISE